MQSPVKKGSLNKGHLHRGIAPKADIVSVVSWILLLGPEVFLVTGLVKFVTDVARLVCQDMFG